MKLSLLMRFPAILFTAPVYVAAMPTGSHSHCSALITRSLPVTSECPLAGPITCTHTHQPHRLQAASRASVSSGHTLLPRGTNGSQHPSLLPPLPSLPPSPPSGLLLLILIAVPRLLPPSGLCQPPPVSQLYQVTFHFST